VCDEQLRNKPSPDQAVDDDWLYAAGDPDETWGDLVARGEIRPETVDEIRRIIKRSLDDIWQAIAADKGRVVPTNDLAEYEHAVREIEGEGEE
jgi:hypothetical protein